MMGISIDVHELEQFLCSLHRHYYAIDLAKSDKPHSNFMWGGDSFAVLKFHTPGERDNFVKENYVGCNGSRCSVEPDFTVIDGAGGYGAGVIVKAKNVATCMTCQHMPHDPITRPDAL